MAYDGLEVEIKLPAPEAVAEGLLTRLRSAGASESRQIDEYFDDPIDSFTTREPIERWLSVRDRRVPVLNHKRFHFGPDGLATHNEESELPIGSVAEGKAFLVALGYRSLVVVDKTRTEAKLDGFIVAVDEIPGLGFFVEIEADEARGTIEETRAALVDYASSLGLDPSSEDHRGYPYMMIRRAREER